MCPRRSLGSRRTPFGSCAFDDAHELRAHLRSRRWLGLSAEPSTTGATDPGGPSIEALGAHPEHAALSSARRRGVCSLTLPERCGRCHPRRGADSPLTSSKVGGSSTPKRLLSTSARSVIRSLGRPRTLARHPRGALPPLRDFRRILRGHPKMTARPRALDPLFTDRASWPMHRSPTSAISRSASTHHRTSTPGGGSRAARLTPRHTEAAAGAKAAARAVADSR